MKLLSYCLLAQLFFSNNVLAQLIYPNTKKILQTETRFGRVIEDPYKWMENASDPDLWSWIEEQKSLTQNYLDADLSDAFAKRVQDFRKIRDEQTQISEKSLIPEAKFSTLPFIRDDKKKSIIKWRENTVHERKSFLNAGSSLYKIQSQTVHSGDLRRLIISQISDNKVVDILLVKFYSFVSWADDSSFYYISDLDERIGGGKPGLFKHTVGQIQSEDQLVYTGKTSSSDLTIHQIGNKFFIEADATISSFQLASGRVSNQLPINGEIVEINDSPETLAVIRSFKNANNGEFHKLRLRDGQRNIFVKEQDFVLEKSIKLNQGMTLIFGLKDASHVVGILNQDASLEMIPELMDGTIEYRASDDESMTLGIETYSQPKKIYKYFYKTKDLKLISSQIYPLEVEADKIFYQASNGQKASMWVFRKKGVSLSSKTPLILYGYGGFRASITPAFGMYESLPWIEKGGAFAVVTLPGSLDYGQSWYDLAKVGGRTHSFDSFALAAKELFSRGWTSSETIGMMGASNGGTLVAGTLERHSALFKAAVPIVGVMDLLNFSLFSAGKYWTEDYGNPFTLEGFEGIFPLSPYHNLKKKNYPATLVMTAEFDDRVVPMHSYKYLAGLQEYNQSGFPTLLYNKEWGGHARASGSARESSRFVSAFYTFFSQQLGLNP